MKRRRGNEDSYAQEYNAMIDKRPNPQLTYENELARLHSVNTQLVELARAFVSYLEDDSKSPRRIETCLAHAKGLIALAEGEPK